MQNSPIESGILEIQYDRSFNDECSFLNESEYFGVLQLQVKKCKASAKPLVFVFTLDKSGSMNDIDFENSKKMSKLEYLKETFMHLVRYFVEQTSTRIFLIVNVFNDTVNTILEPTELNKSIMDAVIEKINGIEAYDSTDIGRAITYSNEMIRKYQKENPENEVIHIFMSDGDPTVGIKTHSGLGDIAKISTCPTIFIGFGKEHNCRLLRFLSDITTGEYQIVDDFEHTTGIFGQAIHPFLYPVLRRPRIEIRNGWIYDWRRGEWVSGINESLYSSEDRKIYQIKTDCPTEVDVFLYDGDEEEGSAELFETVALPELIDIDNSNATNDAGADLRKYMLRQETQQLLHNLTTYKSKDEISYNKRDPMLLYFDRGIKKMRKEMRNLFRRIREYMNAENLTTDIFLITLCDDITIAYKTIYNKDGDMYSVARQASQGRQQTISVTPRRLVYENDRSRDTYDISEDDNDNDDKTRMDTNISLYMPSGMDATCFTSPSLMNTLRSLSHDDHKDEYEYEDINE